MVCPAQCGPGQALWLTPAGCSDEVGQVPGETQHWLRPNRSYRLGRMAHTTKPTKPGIKGAEIKPRMVDFSLKSTAVSKDGAWEVRCEGGDWDEVSQIETEW